MDTGKSRPSHYTGPLPGMAPWHDAVEKRDGGAMAVRSLGEANTQLAQEIRPILVVTADICASVATFGKKEEIEVWTGYNAVRGERLTTGQRVIQGVFAYAVPVLGGVAGSLLRNGSKLAKTLHRTATVADDVDGVLKSGLRAGENVAGAGRVAPRGAMIGAADSTCGPGRQMLNLPVTRQSSANTCVGSCLDMLLLRRKATHIESYALRSGGLTPADMVAFLDDNFAAAGLRTMCGSVEDAIASGKRFIAIVDKGHAVVVDGVRTINGVRHVIVRDPAVGAYLERLDWFLEQRVVRNPDVLGFPAIWGQ